MDPNDFYYTESSSRGYPNTYREEYPQYMPPRTYSSHPPQNPYGRYVTSQRYQPGQFYRTPRPGYSYNTPYPETSYYSPSPNSYHSPHPDYYYQPPLTEPERDTTQFINASTARIEEMIEQLKMGDKLLEEKRALYREVGESSEIHDRVDTFEETPWEEELGVEELPLEETDFEVENISEEETTEPVHDDSDVVIPLPWSYCSLLGIGCDLESVPVEPKPCIILVEEHVEEKACSTEDESTCSTVNFIYPEVDQVALERKSLILFLVFVDDRARLHKNAETRATCTRLNLNMPSQPILESTKAWYERHYFLDPG